MNSFQAYVINHSSLFIVVNRELTQRQQHPKKGEH